MTLERNKQGGIYMKYVYKYSNGNQVVHNKIVTKKTMLREAQGSKSCIINTITEEELYLRDCGFSRDGFYYTTVLL